MAHVAGERWSLFADSAVVASSTVALGFPVIAEPLVSVVMCAKDAERMTLGALRALHDNTPEGLLQVILVDDGSGPEAQRAFGAIEGITLVRNDDSLGFLGASNRGIEEVRGEFTYFLNNDTEVQPGWLEPILIAFDDPTVGAVGSRLINPDGTVQEAGVTIWSDGAGHAHGGGGIQDDEEWLSWAEVDYCSGAALCARTRLVKQLGGFDPRFAPAFYEDVDLCFGIRDLGYRVLVVPESNVLHFGGQSYGKPMAPGQPMARGRVHQFANEPIFAAKWAAVLRQQHLPRGTPAGLVPFRARSRPRILIIDAWIPAHDRDAGGLRMTWIIRLLTRMGVDVTLWATGGPGREKYVQEFRREGVEVWLGFGGFHRVEQRAGLWDIVMVSRPDVGAEVLPAIRRYCSRAPLLYDTVDIHHVRMQREAVVSGEMPDTYEEIRHHEEMMCAAADIVVTVSDADADHLRPLLRHSEHEFLVLPLVQEPWAGAIPGFEARSGLLFIGGYRHVPNQDAATWFASDIWPAIGDQTIPVTFLGDEPPEAVEALRASHGFDVPGFRNDVTHDFNSARVFICPLRFGSGVKGKIIHALTAGVPVVTTAIGAEGMALAPGRDVLVADDPARFAASVHRLHTDPELWSSVSQAGRRRAQEWSPASMERRLRAMLEDLLPPRLFRTLAPDDQGV